MRLVLGNFIGMMDLAMVDPAGVDIEFLAEIFDAHLRTFEMPARRALAPGTVPFHLPGLADGRLAPDCEILWVAFAFDRVDPSLDILALRTG